MSYSFAVRAVVIGVNGQDGQILSSKLLSKGYFVVGITNPEKGDLKIDSQHGDIFKLDLSDRVTSVEFLNEFNPDAIFHLAAVHASSLKMSETENTHSAAMLNCHVGITRNILEWQLHNPKSKSIIALSSQMYRNDPARNIKVDESSLPDSQRMYGATKAQAWELIKEYRQKYGLLTAGAILFNHASVFSKPEYLFSELADKINGAMENNTNSISMRNPSAYVDITCAFEICDALIAITQLDTPQDFVLGSGKSHTISDILEKYFAENGIYLHIENLEADHPEHCLVSSIVKAEKILGWSPKIQPSQLLATIVESRGNGRKKYIPK